MEDEVIRFRDDPEWDDVEPIPLNDDEQGAVRISTTDAFNDAFMYLRALLQTNEISERAFKLTDRCIELNPASYSTWQYRRVLLKGLNKNLDDEFNYIAEIIDDNQKNYQVWHHRRVLVEWSNDPSRELEFTASIINDEPKNYHAWQHRQWVIETYQLYSQAELDYSASLIADDVRNNSAWNYRYFLLEGLDFLNRPDALDKEIAFTEMFIKQAPNNESAWNFLSGILFDKGLSSRTDIFNFCYDLCKTQKVPFCLSFMVDVLIEKIEKNIEREKSSKHAFELLKELKKVDPIRINYWQYCEQLVNNLLQFSQRDDS
ncbi:unnamed protein product [Dracunculus medinensis]|uniref:Protein farnesyltransferase/geranylgeranyltransferase type-1 subunit alpha n=1 Tax=Dracunculus medinensis TaxID=318479 RepID=A0A0N4ULA4_DRAME|nr:unnamed protein product [Dracunculus medinensis]